MSRYQLSLSNGVQRTADRGIDGSRHIRGKRRANLSRGAVRSVATVQPPEDLATAEAFKRDPKLIWRWYDWRRQLLAKAEPNDGHRALVSMEDRCAGFTLTTQNVDGLHARAGSQNILELHGNINRFKCFQENDIVHDWEETDEEPSKCRNSRAFFAA